MAIEVNTLINSSMVQLQQSGTQDFIAMLAPLAYYIIGITLYAVFIFKFYKFLARRDMLRLSLPRYRHGFTGFIDEVVRIILHWIEVIVVIPVLVFFWFIVLTGFLLIIGKSQTPGTILIAGASLVAAVRITSYYSEDLSNDLAKMIPLGLLGVFLVDISYFTPRIALDTFSEILSLWHILIAYFAFIVSIEFIMRTAHFFAGVGKSSEQEN